MKLRIIHYRKRKNGYVGSKILGTSYGKINRNCFNEIHSPGWLEGQLLSYEVAKRRQKPLQQIRAIKRAISISGRDHPQVHEILSDFIIDPPSETDDLVVNTVICEQNKDLQASLRSTCPKQNNQQFLSGSLFVRCHYQFFVSENQSSLPHRLAASRVEIRLGNEAIADIMNGGEMNGTIADFEESLKLMEKVKADTNSVMEGARARWPLASAFGADTSNPPRVLKPLKQTNQTTNKT